jgi:hypothetical protein
MPKEITHWLISDETAKRLGDTCLGRAARGHPNALRFGAVFHDVLFYLTGSDPATIHYRAQANRLHGAQGEDTHELLRRVVAVLPASPCRAPLQAFLVGLASHIRTDATFHPLVFYLTGNYHDRDPRARNRAIRRHRQFEAWLDLRFCGGPARARTYTAERMLRNLEYPLSGLLPELAPLLADNDQTPAAQPALERALRTFRQIQGWLARPLPARLAGLLDPLLPSGVREYTALFYTPSLATRTDRLTGNISFRHPVTGTPGVTTLAQLFEQAVQDSVALCGQLETAIEMKDPSQFNAPGPSLNFGLPHTPVDRARYLAEPAVSIALESRYR